MQTKEQIADDWINQRCKPQYIPFAGHITHPDGVTPFQYTSDNFQFCIQDILNNVTDYALEPFQYMILALTDVFSVFNEAIQQTRVAMDTLRSGVAVITEDIMSRLLNILIPIQKMLISVIDIFSKIQGTMAAGLFTVLGTYYTLQSLMGAMLELIIKILIALAILIVALWMMPFTWSVATSMTAIFLAISIPLTIIVLFMTEILHIKTSGIPGLPSVKTCFDKDTYLSMGKTFETVACGDILDDGSKVTAKMQLSAKGVDMFCLNGIIVSGCHSVFFQGKWIDVVNHPEAIKLPGYTEPYIYCINTSSKQIILNGTTFADWDEIQLQEQEQEQEQEQPIDMDYFHPETIVQMHDNNTKYIKDIQIGDIIYEGKMVYGFAMNDLGFRHLLVSMVNVQNIL